MRALRLQENETLAIDDIPKPTPQAGEVLVKVHAVTLNHLDLFSYRGMAFAKRTLPIIVAAEGVGEVVGLGTHTDKSWLGKRVAIYPSKTCGECSKCREGKDNLCENIDGIFGFNKDGLAAQYVALPERLMVEIPDNLSWENAACAPITFSTVVHMLFDNARLKKGESLLVHAGGSGIGSAAIKIGKHTGATVYTTVGSDEKADKALKTGADHTINYRATRFAKEVRKLTKKRGVDVVFEHVGTDTWEGSMQSVCKGGRIVTCGSTSGIDTTINLFHLFNQQIKIFGSFGGTKKNIADSLALMSEHGITPVIDTVLQLNEIENGLERLRNRQVFGKFVILIDHEDT